MPMQRHRYPKDWPSISWCIRERDGNRCKWCGVANYDTGYRDGQGVWRSLSEEGAADALDVGRVGPELPHVIRIVLTVAHLDHDTTNNSDENLATLCQRCHNRHDAAYRQGNAAATRRQRRIAQGQGVLTL